MAVAEPRPERMEVMATPSTTVSPRRSAASKNNDDDAGMAADRLSIHLDAERWVAFNNTLDRPVADKPRLRRLLTEKSVLE